MVVIVPVGQADGAPVLWSCGSCSARLLAAGVTGWHGLLPLLVAVVPACCCGWL